MMKMLAGRVNGTIALVALALGYIVCSLAKKETGALKTVGYIIGVTIIAISSALIIGKVLFTAKVCPLSNLPMSMQSIPQK